ncbi:MAG: Lrp/AsnC family transcriptional regulator [Thermoplasmata archaeon]
MIKISDLRKGIPISNDPYGDLAKIFSMRKDELIKILNDMVNKGQIIKFRALLDHEKLGYRVSALIAMNMDDENIEKVINLAHITHFYVREKNEKFPYSYFAMAHFFNEDELKSFSKKLDEMHINYEILRTVKNLKNDLK